MAKTSGVIVLLAGTASFCAAYVTHVHTAMEHGVSSQLDIVMDPSSGGDGGLALAPEGWRAYVRTAVPPAPTEDEAAEVVVTIAKRGSEAFVRTLIVPSARPASSGDRAGLVHELQRELRRVGCYGGAFNDSWTVATRTAMKAFTNRINAILPMDKPDPILLALVQGQRDRVCGVACPSGEVLARDDRCLPKVIFAQASRKAPEHSSKLLAEEQSRVLVTTLWSSTTAPPMGVADPGPVAPAARPPTRAHATRVAAAAGARARAGAALQRESQRHSNFGATLFRQFDAFGLH
jgi:hypothetical protein